MKRKHLPCQRRSFLRNRKCFRVSKLYFPESQNLFRNHSIGFPFCRHNSLSRPHPRELKIHSLDFILHFRFARRFLRQFASPPPSEAQLRPNVCTRREKMRLFRLERMNLGFPADCTSFFNCARAKFSALQPTQSTPRHACLRHQPQQT